MSEQHPPADPNQPAPPPHPDDTAHLPVADAAVGAPGDTAQLPPQPAPAGWAPAPAAPTPPEWSAPAAGRPRSGWWGQATSTGGGRAALVAAAVLGVLFLVTGIGLAAALVAGHHRFGDERGTVASWRGDDGMMGPGNGMGRGNGYGRGQGNGNGNGDKDWNGPQQAPGQGAPANPVDPGTPNNPGNGPGLGMGRGMAGFGAVLHGEFTTNVTGTPAVMVVQTGEVTAYTAGKSLTVKSTDGFEATYTLDAATSATGRNGAQLATGTQVRVLAAKDGMKVVWLGAVD